jgi:Na+-translocating ferredoxin:NAD+ oxidoreductase subunit E
VATLSPASVWRDGLWWNNPGLAQLLGLCPLLAVSRSLEAGLGLGAATLGVLVGSSLLVSLARRWLDPRVRLPACVLIIAAFVTAADLLFRAWLFPLYAEVGLFVPLIVTNCVILARAEAFASRNGPWLAVQDALAHGLGFAAVLAVLGFIREHAGIAIALLPAGGFFALAALIALRNRYFPSTTAPGTDP